MTLPDSEPGSKPENTEPLPPMEFEPKPPAPSPDTWKSKFKTRVFECYVEDGPEELTAPPFPFRQQWDPRDKDIRAKGWAQEAQEEKKRQDQARFQDHYRDWIPADQVAKSEETSSGSFSHEHAFRGRSSFGSSFHGNGSLNHTHLEGRPNGTGSLGSGMDNRENGKSTRLQACGRPKGEAAFGHQAYKQSS